MDVQQNEEVLEVSNHHRIYWLKHQSTYTKGIQYEEDRRDSQIIVKMAFCIIASFLVEHFVE